MQEGEPAMIPGNGEAPAEPLTANRKGGFPFGLGCGDPLVPVGDEYGGNR
jgi:hypothetical protein